MRNEDAVTIIKDVCKEDYKNIVVREALDIAIEALEKQMPSNTSSHDEKHILQGCIALMSEMVDYFREYLDFIGYEPEFDEDKMPFVMSYFHIVQRLFLWNTRHSGGNSTRTKCYELGIEDSSENVEFYLWKDEEE